ncbi:methionine aminopeptidase [Camelliibacillus cellulosilyticus]|uniref:Methionine aminopeptidase n=1 Tax=Camelliibacillus cellulosilyticus TaxID=2174486 RepID=A0ABV9GKH9_9BACL
MNVFNAYSNWRAGRQEKHRSKMEALGKCPDCRGRGFLTLYDYEYAAPFDCPSCDGSGLYSDWEAKQ